MIDKVNAVKARIEAAATRANRLASEVVLVAVTKTHPLETVIEAHQTGLRHFGENRIIEKEKVTEMGTWIDADSSREAPTWHFIGHIQTRQAGDVLGRYSLIHSLDSLKLAERIQRLAERDDHVPVDVLVQCNVSGEASKSGFELSNWATDKTQLTAFLAQLDTIAALDKLHIRGLMTMAPIVDDPERVRPVFKSLAGLRQRLQEMRSSIDWQHLSMGMTDDFEVAIEEGATIVRVGRALFGERQILAKQ